MNYWDSYPTNRLLAEVSLWSADFTCFKEEILRMDPYADLYHIDVADNHFVPGLLFFPDLVASLRPLTKKAFHVHLMSDNPLNLIDEFAMAGADLISIQAELGPLALESLKKIHALGKGAGLAVGLETSIETLITSFQAIDVVILMGTAMGVKGAEPSQATYSRIQDLHVLLEREGFSRQVKIEADGGIREHTVPSLCAAGADLIVMGSLAFKSKDLDGIFKWVHQFTRDWNDLKM